MHIIVIVMFTWYGVIFIPGRSIIALRTDSRLLGINEVHDHLVGCTVEPLYKDTPEMRTSLLIRTLSIVPVT